jgi:hypothetical protein
LRYRLKRNKELAYQHTYQDKLDGSAKAGSGGFVVCGPAIIRENNHRKAFAVRTIHEFGGVETLS